jgi:hypothetical protein
MISTESKFTISKAINNLQQRGQVHVVKQLGYRVYHQESLTILTNMFFTVKKEFFGLKKGKWTECTELEADNSTLLDYSHQKFHSEIIACLLTI